MNLINTLMAMTVLMLVIGFCLLKLEVQLQITRIVFQRFLP